MDRYLDIAATILKSARRPLGPRAILSLAYQSGLVPAHLHGKTQHKTLQARISEDILARRDQSAFFRPEPGLFFLREFLTDETLPEVYRVPMATRRRMRDLLRGPALGVERSKLLETAGDHGECIPVQNILALLHAGDLQYADPKSKTEELIFIWSFVLVRRAQQVLSYRQGRYRESRDAFALRRTVGFSSLVQEDQSNLFNLADFGIVDAGVQATMLDLDIPTLAPLGAALEFRSHLKYFLWQPDGVSRGLVAVVEFECPSWFEPLTRRLAINDLRWIDIFAINDLDDFDPWSKAVIMNAGLRKDRQEQPA